MPTIKSALFIALLMLSAVAHAMILVTPGKYDTQTTVILSHGVPTAIFNIGTRSEIRLALKGNKVSQLKSRFHGSDLVRVFKLKLNVAQLVSDGKGSAELLGFEETDQKEIPAQVGNNLVPNGEPSL